MEITIIILIAIMILRIPIMNKIMLIMIIPIYISIKKIKAHKD